MVNIKKNIADIVEKINEAAKASSRGAGEIKLMAVSKTRTIEEMLLASECISLFGENRIKEVQDKRPKWPADNKIEWHLIGHLQKNKARKALDVFDTIDSVDSFELARTLDRILAENNRQSFPILIEVNMSGEISKNGVDPDLAQLLLENILSFCPNLKVEGLMTIGPLTTNERIIRKTFAGLRMLRDSIKTNLGVNLPELSMGMSDDFLVAIEEGSTIVRIGTGIFGTRV